MQQSDTSTAVLRSIVDLAPYTPDSMSPRWLQGAARIAHNDPGVLALLGPTGLSITSERTKRNRVVPDTPSLFLAALVDRLRSTKRHVAIGIPPVARHLPLLLAGSSVLANVVDKTPIGPGRSDGSVLIVSPDLDVRTRYCDLNVGPELLDEAYPGSRVRPDGTRVPLHPVPTGHGVHGVCFFLPLLSLPDDIAIHPSTIVLDVRYARWVRRISDLASWAARIGGHAGVVGLYSIGDTDTRDALINAGFTDYPFDQAAIVACAEHTEAPTPRDIPAVDWNLAVAPEYLVREHEVVLVPQVAEVERALAAASRLLFEQAQHGHISPMIQRARWILATLNHLPVPLVVYEYSARGLGRRQLRSLLDGLGASRTTGYGLPSAERALKDALDQVYNLLWQHNPRVEKLRATLPMIAAQQGERQVLLLVRDQVVGRAMQSWIADEAFPGAPWISSLDIQACPGYVNVASRLYDQALVVGALPWRFRWIASGALASHVTFVAYPHEIDALRRQLEAIYGDEGRIARSQQRDVLMQELSPSARLSDGPESAIAPLHLVVPKAESGDEPRPSNPKRTPPIKHQVTIRDLSQLDAALQKVAQREPNEDRMASTPTWTEDPGDDDPPEDEMHLHTLPEPGYGEPVLCRRLHVNSRAYGRGTMWLPQDRGIEVYRQADTDDLMVMTPDKLKPGDVVLVMRDLERTSLFDRMVHLAEGQPQMHYLAARRRVWQDAVRRMAARHTFDNRVDYKALLRDLQHYGAPIQSELAVRFWVQGDVIGPESLNSIIAVGRASGTSELVHRAREFDHAFRDIRGIRQSIGMRLNAAIRQAFRQVTEGEPPSASRLNTRLDISDRLGIALDELIDSIDLAQIISVDATPQRIPLYQVGHFQRQ